MASIFPGFGKWTSTDYGIHNFKVFISQLEIPPNLVILLPPSLSHFELCTFAKDNEDTPLFGMINRFWGSQKKF